MIDIFQVYKKHAHFVKSNYNDKVRKSFLNWDNELTSKNGFIDKHILYLPAEEKNNPLIANSSVIIIQDIIGYSTFNNEQTLKKQKLPEWFINDRISSIKERNPERILFQGGKKSWQFEIFNIEKNEDSEFKLDFLYGLNKTYIGEPKREDHQIAKLTIDQPVRFSVNGKSDSTMTGGKERTYCEFDYIIEYVGSIDSIEFLAPSQLSKVKKIPKPIKTIDERKILY